LINILISAVYLLIKYLTGISSYKFFKNTKENKLLNKEIFYDNVSFFFVTDYNRCNPALMYKTLNHEKTSRKCSIDKKVFDNVDMV